MAESAKRLLRLIAHVATAEQGIGLIEVATRAGLDKSTTARLLSAAQDEGWIWRHPEAKYYEPGPELLRIASMAGLPHSVDQLVRASLQRLRDATGETATFQAVVGERRVCLAGVESKHHLRTSIPSTEVLPLDGGLVGKCLLAYCQESVRQRVLSELAPVARREKVQDLIGVIREQGFVEGVSDRTPGISTSAAPLFSSGQLLGVLAVTGPSERFDSQSRASAVTHLLRERQVLGSQLEGREKGHQTRRENVRG